MINWRWKGEGNLHREEDGLLSRAARNLLCQPNRTWHMGSWWFFNQKGFHLDTSSGNSAWFCSLHNCWNFPVISHSHHLTYKCWVQYQNEEFYGWSWNHNHMFSTQVRYNYTQLCLWGKGSGSVNKRSRFMTWNWKADGKCMIISTNKSMRYQRMCLCDSNSHSFHICTISALTCLQGE